MERQRAYLRKLGFMAPVDIELKERGRTLTPDPWGRAAVLTVGFGHGMAVTPLHLATAYAALVTGCIWRPATLETRDAARVPECRPGCSESTSRQLHPLPHQVGIVGPGRKAAGPG